MANFLFVLNNDDNESATRCFQFAKIAHEQGHHVDLFFINDGVMWANKDRDMTIKTKADDCALDYLCYLVEHEIIIGICTPCAKGRKIDEKNFYSNMQLDGGPHLIDMAAKAKVFNF